MLWLDQDLKRFCKIFIFPSTQKMTKVTRSDPLSTILTWNDDKSDKVRFLSNHFNQRFSNFVSNEDSQNINEHIAKVKCQSSIQ